MFLVKVGLVAVAVALGWAYQAAQPPSPLVCGRPGGPPVTSPRIRLDDGRHLAYREAGVARDQARHKIIFAHGFGSSKEADFPISQDLVEELGIYQLYFDRAGYGESDPNPKRGLRSEAMDVEELAGKLQLGPKFYVVGTSMGGYTAWSCLNYIPHRLAGLALVVPAVNYWWPLPIELSRSVFSNLDVGDRRTFWIAHSVPSLIYAWLRQKWFRISPVVAGHPDAFVEEDWEILREVTSKQPADEKPVQDKATQQGIYESLCRDLMVLFSHWEFDPTQIENPFPDMEGVVSIWQGYKDRVVPVEIQRHVARKLPWIRYHEHPAGGHLFFVRDGWGDKLIRELLIGEEPLGL